jgi:ribosomal protein S18 acetylase RimI-like enzyme
LALISDVLIREASAADLPELGELWRHLQRTNAAYEPRLTPSAGSVRWFIDYLQEQIGTRGVAVLIAEVEGVVVGYTFGQILRRPTLQSGDCGYVADLCVREEYRGRGIGRRLYEHLRAWFLSRGVGAIEVQVIRANPASQTFWRKMGFNDFLRTLRNDL